MARDPAFLFYDGDAARDVSHMNRLERGAYFDLLQLQRKIGRLPLDQIKKMLGKDFDSVWESLKICLSYENDMYFIGWVEDSTIKRQRYSQSRSENRKGSKQDKIGHSLVSYEYHMENEIEIGKEIEDKNINNPQVALRSPIHHNENSAEMQGYFDAFFRKYPRPEGEEEAKRAYLDRIHNPSDAAGLLSALSNYLKSDAVRANFVKSPAKFIRDWKTWLHPTPAMMQGGKQKEKEVPRPIVRSKQEEEALYEKLNSEILRREGVDVTAVNKLNQTKSAVDDSKTLTEEEIQRKKEEARRRLSNGE